MKCTCVPPRRDLRPLHLASLDLAYFLSILSLFEPQPQMCGVPRAFPYKHHPSGSLETPDIESEIISLKMWLLCTMPFLSKPLQWRLGERREIIFFALRYYCTIEFQHSKDSLREPYFRTMTAPFFPTDEHRMEKGVSISR